MVGGQEIQKYWIHQILETGPKGLNFHGHQGGFMSFWGSYLLQCLILISATHTTPHIMGSQAIQETIINMLVLADEQQANIFLLIGQGEMQQADILNRMLICLLNCIQDLQVKLSDAT
ncbi:MAG: hypothetical protein GY830_00270, partial [Bacteroidetes bacterium]|nr:hypothetical protein [Bacteroidota bacterium]